MPDLTTLYLTNGGHASYARGVSRTDAPKDATSFREFIREPNADHFQGVEALMHKLPNLRVTGKATVRVLFIDFNDGATLSAATAFVASENWEMTVDFNRNLFTNLRVVRN